MKREDLCCPYPGPSFSKMRGVWAHMRNRPERTIGVLDTLHSKAGWAVSWAGAELGKEVVNFWPRFKRDGDVRFPRIQQTEAWWLGAELHDLAAGRSAILYHRARRWMREHRPGSYMMPNALKLEETITETAAEVERTPLPRTGTMIISVSSATVAAGVLLGMEHMELLGNYHVVLHMGYSRSQDTIRQHILHMAGVNHRADLIDEGYAYADRVDDHGAPFPCNPHYDGKAWKWLSNNDRDLDFSHPVVFWNIGA